MLKVISHNVVCSCITIHPTSPIKTFPLVRPLGLVANVTLCRNHAECVEMVNAFEAAKLPLYM